MTSKFKIQEEQYHFPYHYLPHFEDERVPVLGRQMSWGLEYLTYTSAVVEELLRLPARSILDVGCGDGRLLNTIGGRFERALGIDLAPQSIAFARAFAQSSEFEVANLVDIKEAFDVVSCVEVLEHVPDEHVEGFVAALKERVAKNGFLVVCVPTTVYPLNKKHYRHYDEELLSQHLNLGDHFESIRELRIHRVSKRLKVASRLMNNRFYSIRWSRAWKKLWCWHTESGMYASRTDGAHLLVVARRKES